MQSVSKSTTAIIPGARANAPVFVLGCPRSGTTVLYHMLLSAGGFAVYRSESHAFDLLASRFGNMKVARNRERLLQSWFRSKFFRVSGLSTDEIGDKIRADCRTAGDFLRLTMEAVAQKQGVQRWADCTPHHLLYIREIKRQIPDALIIHIIRDGRDVALSFAKQGWTRPLPWDHAQELEIAALYWSWIVQQGREQGRSLGNAYVEVRYEDMVADPRKLLAQLSNFIDQELNYDHIQAVGIGAVSSPNTSFQANPSGKFNPVGRWKTNLPAPQLARVEALISERLQELGYPMSQEHRSDARVHYLRLVYPRLFAAKVWLKDHTPLGRLADTSLMELQ